MRLEQRHARYWQREIILFVWSDISTALLNDLTAVLVAGVTPLLVVVAL